MHGVAYLDGNVQEALDGVNVAWMDKASDHDYLSPVADAYTHGN